jgi:hypothetical protein
MGKVKIYVDFLTFQIYAVRKSGPWNTTFYIIEAVPKSEVLEQLPLPITVHNSKNSEMYVIYTVTQGDGGKNAVLYGVFGHGIMPTAGPQEPASGIHFCYCHRFGTTPLLRSFLCWIWTNRFAGEGLIT